MKPWLAVWLALGIVLAAAAQEGDAPPQAQVLLAPGSYPAPAVIDLVAPPGASVRYRFLETQGTATFPWNGPLSLDALAGETRPYTLRMITDLATGEAVTKDYRYSVSRPAAPVATVQPEPGHYWSAVTVRPSLPGGWKLLEDGVVRTYPRILDAPLGQTKTWTLEARGPSGETMVWPFTVDRRDQGGAELEIVSPREGVWANAQTLAVAFRGVDRVVWSYGKGLDPRATREYTGPLVLDQTGNQTVTVSARSRLDGNWVERTVSWTAGDQSVPAAGWPASGARTTGIDLPVVPEATISWDEGNSWQPAVRTSEAASTSLRKILSVQVRTPGAPVPFRYLYWLDARAPEAPAVEFTGGWNPKVVFSGSAEALHRVTWTRSDGTAVDEPGVLWGPVGSWKVPDGVVAARVQVVGVNQVSGPPASVGFPETGWSTPVWEPWDQKGPQTDSGVLPLGGRILARPGFWPVYEVSSRPDVPEPSAASPLLSGPFLPTFPWGSDRTLYARFAWRDAGGLTGPATAITTVRVDRVPPLAPEVVLVGGQVVVKAAEGEEEGESLFWAVTGSRVASAESLSLQSYRGPVDAGTLKASGPGKLWFHAQAFDRAGNSGPVRLNVALPPPNTDGETSVVQVDPDPAVGESLVENGGVYPWSSFRLRSLDQSKDLWVGVADQGGLVPADWKTRVQPWTGTLSRSIARGERRTFVLFWNAKTTTGWAWPQPKTLSLTLDQGPPAAPVVSGMWPSTPLPSAWSLDVKPGQTGDLLRYTYSLDGQVPADPVTAGELWTGTRTWDGPAGGRVEVRVRMAAVSVGGVAVEVPLAGPVTIDRVVPGAVVPDLEPFTYQSGPFVVKVPEGSPVVRYSLTSDGKLPEVPTASSPAVGPRGLSLDGIDGKNVLYRFRWRSFSPSGISGPVTDTFGVLVDRSAPLVNRAPGETEGNSRVPLPRLSGLPPTGTSASAVTLGVDWVIGLVRYEVREGLGGPRPVGPTSAPWVQPLVLDGGPGVDRSYAVSYRGYSTEGKPLTDEVTVTVRVDRALPGAPVLDLVPDTRRPEVVLKDRTGTHSSEEVLSYRWTWDPLGGEKGTSSWVKLGQDPVVFSAPGGDVTRLKVEAFLQDEAGNVGPTSEQSLLIDQNAIYLAPAATGSGSRAQPLGSVAEAVDRAHREGKSVLLVAAGSYPVLRTLDLGGLRIFGGLSGDWETTSDPTRSHWTAEGPFQGTSLVESEGQLWSLENVDLATGAVPLAQVVSVQGGTVTLRNTAWAWSGASRGWVQEGGALDWTNVTASYTAEPNGTFLEARSADVQVRAFSLTATQNQGGLLVSLRDTKALFQDLALVSKKAQGFDGLLSASGSVLTVDQARILAGDGADRTTAFVLKESDAALWNTEVSLYGNLSNTGYQTTGGRLEVQKGSLSLLKGKEFNQGLVLDGTETVLRSWELKVESGAYQGGLTADGGSLTLSASKVRLAGGGQRVWGAQFLSPVAVKIADVNWVLGTKTPGDLWKLDRPWVDGSSALDSVATGW